MSNHTAQLEEYAMLLSRDTTPDRTRSIGNYVVSVQSRLSRGTQLCTGKWTDTTFRFCNYLCS